MEDWLFQISLFNYRQKTNKHKCWTTWCILIYMVHTDLLGLYWTTVEPLKTGNSVNRNSLETEQLAWSRIFSLYFHCIKIPVNRNPSILETGQAFYYFLTISTFLSPKLFWQYMCWHNYTRFSHPWPVVASINL